MTECNYPPEDRTVQRSNEVTNVEGHQRSLNCESKDLAKTVPSCEQEGQENQLLSDDGDDLLLSERTEATEIETTRNPGESGQDSDNKL